MSTRLRSLVEYGEQLLYLSTYDRLQTFDCFSLETTLLKTT